MNRATYRNYYPHQGDGSGRRNMNQRQHRQQQNQQQNSHQNSHQHQNQQYKDRNTNYYLEKPSIYNNFVNPTKIWNDSVSTSSPVTLDVNHSYPQRRFSPQPSINQSQSQPTQPQTLISNPSLQSTRKPMSPRNQTSQQQQQLYSNKRYNDNDYSNHYIHTGEQPSKFVRNVKNPVEGYPKLQRLFQLKERQTQAYACTPFGSRCEVDNMVPTLKKWINKDQLVFDVIMIGSLTENQFIYPLLTQLPLEKLCSKPGFLFVWASGQKINELTRLLNSDSWAKRFRRSEELVFVPVDKNSPYYPNKDSQDDESLFEKMQWHCWMCITGTVRRSTDGNLIHCNVDTDLNIEDEDLNNEENKNLIVPNHIYKVAENFSSANRRLHIIPSRSGYNNPVRPRRGWVIMSPDIILDNFEPKRYKDEILEIGVNVPQDSEIENLRPKSPIPRNSNLNQTTMAH
ncbi:Karyogamy protein KAR4 [Wickerhamomyces ciferrii]|uniref:Karyogamy protein KAR4 n=1 Tax=Wickerhamomyces ciferrii (strain ATCC 14091 / BCRC 22168 / CBS 111 / JCM 3599 / NBRC 0793 / NRRL Y-1031 F-60-10) TaxID=1206466 RepID=K0KQR2_WICCF|nr:Karyogamy protein KAR4 [Wickerhamomyces ciferrii]CCH45416.1 Karyogamy protein KAR4 [Wickerhamomyces ciferrii]